MAVDMFINLGQKIKGESHDAAQSKNNDCDVLAWSWGLSNSGTAHMGGGSSSGKAHFQDLSFTKYLDSGSHAIALHCATGEHIPKVVLLMRKGTGISGQQAKYLEITMEHVIITSVHTGGSGSEDRLTENVTLNFAKVKLEYFKQDSKGAVKSAGEFVYNIEANKAG